MKSQIFAKNIQSFSLNWSESRQKFTKFASSALKVPKFFKKPNLLHKENPTKFSVCFHFKCEMVSRRSAFAHQFHLGFDFKVFTKGISHAVLLNRDKSGHFLFVYSNCDEHIHFPSRCHFHRTKLLLIEKVYARKRVPAHCCCCKQNGKLVLPLLICLSDKKCATLTRKVRDSQLKVLTKRNMMNKTHTDNEANRGGLFVFDLNRFHLFFSVCWLLAKSEYAAASRLMEIDLFRFGLQPNTKLIGNQTNTVMNRAKLCTAKSGHFTRNPSWETRMHGALKRWRNRNVCMGNAPFVLTSVADVKCHTN